MFRKLILSLFFIPITLFSQIITYYPEKPTVGDNITISYNPFCEGAKFSINRSIYAIIWQNNQDGNYLKYYKLLERSDSSLVLTIKVSKEASIYFLYFITLSEEEWDMNAITEVKVYDKTGIAVRNANVNLFEDELKLYPDNYYAYRNKWFNEKHGNPEQYKIIVKKDLKELVKKNEATIELLFAKAYGYLLVDEKEKSLELIRIMVSKYSSHAYTFDIINLFLYELQTNRYNGPLNKSIIELTEELILKENDSPYSFDLAWTTKSTDLSDNCQVSINKSWIRLEPENPHPYMLMAYLNKEKDFISARLNIEKFIELTLKGNLRLFSDISGASVKYSLNEAYSLLSEISMNMKDFKAALSAIRTAQTFWDPNDKVLIQEGDIWFELGDIKQAQKMYAKAWRLGSNEVESKLRKCFAINNNSSEKFDEYLSDTGKFDEYFLGIKKETNQSNEPVLSSSETVNDFNVNTIDNDIISLKYLKGKVVVLNFWYTGCGPCKKEIPELNKLVNKYNNNKVVFLAFSLDKKELLEKFLKQIPFDYKIIPDAEKTAQEYNVKAYPTHIIINQEGKKVFTMLGSSNDIKDKLAAVIDRML